MNVKKNFREVIDITREITSGSSDSTTARYGAAAGNGTSAFYSTSGGD